MPGTRELIENVHIFHDYKWRLRSELEDASAIHYLVI